MSQRGVKLLYLGIFIMHLSINSFDDFAVPGVLVSFLFFYIVLTLVQKGCYSLNYWDLMRLLNFLK